MSCMHHTAGPKLVLFKLHASLGLHAEVWVHLMCELRGTVVHAAFLMRVRQH